MQSQCLSLILIGSITTDSLMSISKILLSQVRVVRVDLFDDRSIASEISICMPCYPMLIVVKRNSYSTIIAPKRSTLLDFCLSLSQRSSEHHTIPFLWPVLPLPFAHRNTGSWEKELVTCDHVVESARCRDLL